MRKIKKVIVTGGAGFIGSACIRTLLNSAEMQVLNIDKLTYAGNLETTAAFRDHPMYSFAQIDICQFDKLQDVFLSFEPNAILHLAAESHVDRSIDGPDAFIQTNIIGTYNLLKIALGYFQKLDAERKNHFLFQHISTDEVFGSLGDEGFFTEETPYQPSSPYSSSKASSDHLVRAWNKTYGLPTIITNCSNNYGPYQYPEKLIPLIIMKALRGEKLPIYGRGDNVRDWLYVEDHAKALVQVMLKAKVGETYNVGGRSEKNNLEVVQVMCRLLNQMSPHPEIKDYTQLIQFVEDRPGHDKRYAIDCAKITRELGWRPDENFETGMKKTIQWYLDNQAWVQSVTKSKYLGQRLGVAR